MLNLISKGEVSMNENSVWQKAQTIELEVAKDILPEFDIGFDRNIPTDIEKEMRSFVAWMEENYCRGYPDISPGFF